MNIIYYNYPEGTKKLAFTITDKKVKELKEIGAIPQSSVTLIKKVKDIKAEEMAKRVHIDKCVFDSYEQPKAILFDMEMMRMYYLELYKGIREEAFAILDNLQIRALSTGRHEVVSEIEEDKRILRDMPKLVNFKGAKTAMELSRIYPPMLLVDYEEKYRSKLS